MRAGLLVGEASVQEAEEAPVPACRVSTLLPPLLHQFSPPSLSPISFLPSSQPTPPPPLQSFLKGATMSRTGIKEAALIFFFST